MFSIRHSSFKLGEYWALGSVSTAGVVTATFVFSVWQNVISSLKSPLVYSHVRITDLHSEFGSFAAWCRMFSSCMVYSSTPGILGSGLVNTTIVLKAIVSPPAVNVQQ